MDRGEIRMMLQCYRKAAELTPEDPPAQYHLGKLYLENRFLDEAQACFEKAIRLKPGLIEPHLDLGLNLLHKGQYARGWQEMEWRLRTPQRHITIYPFDYPVPCWDGENFTGKTLLVHSEQGFD
jgi:tetratricopeptide (TPR) repeat protein